MWISTLRQVLEFEVPWKQEVMIGLIAWPCKIRILWANWTDLSEHDCIVLQTLSSRLAGILIPKGGMWVWHDQMDQGWINYQMMGMIISPQLPPFDNNQQENATSDIFRGHITHRYTMMAMVPQVVRWVSKHRFRAFLITRIIYYTHFAFSICWPSLLCHCFDAASGHRMSQLDMCTNFLGHLTQYAHLCRPIVGLSLQVSIHCEKWPTILGVIRGIQPPDPGMPDIF